MSNASYIALSRQLVLEKQLDHIARNIANADSSGYQAQRSMFSEFLARAGKNDEPLAYVTDPRVLRDLKPGPLISTGNPLDLAVHEEGYFVVETDQGFRYTRDGSFRLDQDGQLVTQAGAAVMDEGDGPIVFAPEETEIRVAADGTVSTENGEIGRLRVVTFDDQQQMRRVGDNLLATDQRPLDAPEARVVQGMVEDSNIEPVLEITRMIDVMRSYQGTARMIESEHERQRRAIQSLTRTA